MIVEEVEIGRSGAAVADEHHAAEGQDHVFPDVGRNGIDEGDDVGDGFDHARIDFAKEAGDVEERDGLAGQVADDRDRRGEDIDKWLDRIGDILDTLDEGLEEVGEERAEVQADVFEGDVAEIEGAISGIWGSCAQIH